MRHGVVYLHPACQRQHVIALLAGDGRLGQAEHAGDLVQCQAVLTDLDVVVRFPGPLGSQPVLYRDQDPVQASRQIVPRS